jgi:two-component system OmpR family sensor kinase
VSRRHPAAHRHGRHDRGRLHGRIFRWFGAAILSTGVAVAIVFHFLGDGGVWSRQRDGAFRFVGGELARTWDDPAGRTAVVAALGRDLELGLELRDTGGAVLQREGTCDRPNFTVPVPGRGQLLVCTAHHPSGLTWRLALGVLAAVGVLWLASGRIARRIARPIVHLAGVARDLGDGKLASRARLDWREMGEIGTLTTAINDMAGKIERQMRDQRELLAAVSHELRTPLGHVRVIGDLLAASADPVHLAQLEQEVLEMDRLVGELLAGARLDFSAMNATRLDARTLAATALERSGIPAGRLHVDTGETHVEADATLLLRAIGNLIDNAERHGKGLVHLSLRSRPGHLLIEAEDAGPGFSEAELPRAFEPFQRRAADGDDGRSLGLGLSLVRRIAEAHGGAAYVRNRDGGGAVVGMELPRSPAGAPA